MTSGFLVPTGGLTVIITTAVSTPRTVTMSSGIEVQMISNRTLPLVCFGSVPSSFSGVLNLAMTVIRSPATMKPMAAQITRVNQCKSTNVLFWALAILKMFVKAAFFKSIATTYQQPPRQAAQADREDLRRVPCALLRVNDSPANALN